MVRQVGQTRQFFGQSGEIADVAADATPRMRGTRHDIVEGDFMSGFQELSGEPCADETTTAGEKGESWKWKRRNGESRKRKRGHGRRTTESIRALTRCGYLRRTRRQNAEGGHRAGVGQSGIRRLRLRAEAAMHSQSWRFPWTGPRASPNLICENPSRNAAWHYHRQQRCKEQGARLEVRSLK